TAEGAKSAEQSTERSRVHSKLFFLFPTRPPRPPRLIFFLGGPPMIAPSILAADFSRLGEQVREAESGGADRIHVDVMDGHFVPNLSMGPVVAVGLQKDTNLPLEVHLMVAMPAKFTDFFLAAGADSLIVHHEVLPDARPLIRDIRTQGKKAGVAINPGTDVEVLERYLEEIDLALCMTVWPGFGGQAFIPESYARISALRKLIDRMNPR